ncbi:hypothetical protein [Bradyrhizobium icense]|uniref:hypothetical protein n=1 Tax=Bradyrhizobium icense TaxID=1274631 RepID=UPI0012EA7EFC|nr:hypothetical protein [Bradyrhizobium icense]
MKTEKIRQMAQATLDNAKDAVSIAYEINQPRIASRRGAIQQAWERASWLV